ncbi:MAG: TolC family protein [Calditrichaeota bacterium]|nr:TolC family protein [Calditrichota bacterium]RQW04731.1 MAG: TolC family protein [Calditrichota bacterium]
MRIRILLFLLITILPLHILKAEEQDSTLFLDDLVGILLTDNPELKASYQQWKSVQEEIPQAGALPDPVLGLGFMNVPVDNFVFDREPMTGKQLSLMQMVPFPGKLGVRKQIARDDADIEKWKYMDRRNSLINQLKNNYYELFFVHKAIETNRNNQKVLEQLVQVAETRYRVGKGIQQDILSAQVAISKMTDNLLILQQKKKMLESTINVLLNRPPKQFRGIPVEIKTESLDLNLEEIMHIARENNPFLMIRESTVRQNENRVKLARKEYLPDLSVQISYTRREELQNGMPGVDFISGMVNVTLPVYFWKKQNKQVEKNRLQEMSSRSLYQSAVTLIRENLEITYQDLKKNQKRMELFESGIIPLIRQSLQSALSAYQVDKIDFLSVLDNQMKLYEYELEFYRIVTDYMKNIAELELIAGKELQPTKDSKEQ